jgi:hypothetical protein
MRCPEHGLLRASALRCTARYGQGGAGDDGTGRQGRGGPWPHAGGPCRPRTGNRRAQGSVRPGPADHGRARSAGGPDVRREDLRRTGRTYRRHPRVPRRSRLAACPRAGGHAGPDAGEGGPEGGRLPARRAGPNRGRLPGQQSHHSRAGLLRAHGRVRLHRLRDHRRTATMAVPQPAPVATRLRRRGTPGWPPRPAWPRSGPP